jgi:hypothetical protein
LNGRVGWQCGNVSVRDTARIRPNSSCHSKCKRHDDSYFHEFLRWRRRPAAFTNAAVADNYVPICGEEEQYLDVPLGFIDRIIPHTHGSCKCCTLKCLPLNTKGNSNMSLAFYIPTRQKKNKTMSRPFGVVVASHLDGGFGSIPSVVIFYAGLTLFRVIRA